YFRLRPFFRAAGEEAILSQLALAVRLVNLRLHPGDNLLAIRMATRRQSNCGLFRFLANPQGELNRFVESRWDRFRQIAGAHYHEMDFGRPGGPRRVVDNL